MSVSKLRRYVKKSHKRRLKKSSIIQSRIVHDVLTEIVLYEQKQLDDICTSNQNIILGLI